MSFLREQVVKRVTRSPEWSATRKEHLKSHPRCAVCGKRKGVEVHHIKPFHLFRCLELDPLNLKTLCRRHHFVVGHLEYWKSYNPRLDETISYFKNLLESRP